MLELKHISNQMWGQPPSAVRRAQPGSLLHLPQTRKSARDARLCFKNVPHYHCLARMANNSCPYSMG
jgi:hypothetical protein